MRSEFNENGEPKDRTKLIWIGIALALTLMLGALWRWARPSETVSQVRIRQILVAFKHGDEADRARALELITSLRERIVKGDSFAGLAEKYSNDTLSAGRGGDVGWVLKNVLENTVDAYAWEAPLRQISEIIQASQGFHLIEVMDRRISRADEHEMELRRKMEEQMRAEEAARKSGQAAPAPTPSTAPSAAQ